MFNVNAYISVFVLYVSEYNIWILFTKYLQLLREYYIETGEGQDNNSDLH